LAYIQVIRTKVQIVTDASTRAAGRAYVETGSEADALTAANQLAALNPIESVIIPIEATDLEFGMSQRGSKNKAYNFTEATNGNAVRLTTNAFANGAGTAIQTFFPNFVSSMEIRPTCTATNTQTTLDVALIVDRSGSMAFAADETSGGGTPDAAPDDWKYGDQVPPNSRWLDLVTAVDGFCDELSATAKVEKVALVSYSDTVTADEDLTEDYKKISDRTDDISSKFHGGYTDIGGGIMEGLSSVTHPSKCRPWANNALVLMSDGNHNTGTDPIDAANEVVARGIPIYTVSFSDEADQALMQQIADMTGGTHYHAVNAAQLNEAFRNIARRLPGMLTQ
jgi:Mg-chelatase subunit ChlD